ncbi:MAG TPA: 6-carboxytetrahydropterin synthase QueD [Candidatus Saccharimonadales bacterium]|nr:6-carboxytetrahydropterin synthase QueD [Candidatus Saccharimonadales bacterium]
MIVCKEFTFDSAHKLNNYNGKCANLHGHTYKLQICVKGEIQKNGLVLDFLDIKEVVKKKVLAVLDHKYLNDIIEQPSAENITMWIWEQLHSSLPLIYEITLWETPNSFAKYTASEK